jgi:hypothetical protein
MTRFEYKFWHTEHCTPESLLYLNKLGLDGWEMVSAMTTVKQTFVFTLKRPLK